MTNQTQAEVTKAALKELFDLWDQRAKLYGEVMYCSALARLDDGEWRNVFTFFQPLHKCEQRTTDLKADYGDFRLAQGLLPLEKAKQTLTEIAEKETLSLPDQPAVRIEASLQPRSSRHFWRGDARNYPVHFPFFEYRFGVDQRVKAWPPQGTVFATNLPLYPSGHVAIEECFFTRLGQSGVYEGVLSTLVPDYRGKIAEIRVLDGGVAVRVECLAGAEMSDLAGKFYCEADYGLRSTENLRFDADGRAFVPAKGFPRQLVIALFSKSTGERIDERTFDANSPYPPGDLTIEEAEKSIETLITGGESDRIEFKSQIPKSREGIAIGAVAFANQKGGTILVGVDNEGQIVGFSAEGAKETLASMLRDLCEPPLEFSIQEATVQSKTIFIITVPEGKDKPYQVKNRGFYVRTGATNRLVTRYELDEIYNLKSAGLNLDELE